jgi:hypothetical protein
MIATHGTMKRGVFLRGLWRRADEVILLAGQEIAVGVMAQRVIVMVVENRLYV